MRILSLLTTLLVAAFVSQSLAANTGDEVVVVYNSRMPESKAVADYYARRRHVPVDQVFGFSLTTNQAISRAEFRDWLQNPLAKMIAEKKLWRQHTEIMPATNGRPARAFWKVKESKVRYAVLCYGVPVRILRDPDLKEKEEEQQRPELRRNEASVDTELALLPSLDLRLPLTGLLQNPYYTATNSSSFDPTNGVWMVTRLDGPSAEIARGLVDKAIQAENDGLWGRAYIDLRNTTEPGYKPGDDMLRSAGALCRQLGFETTVDEQPETFPPEFPMSDIAFYAGWYEANISGPLGQPKVEFMPGAFAYHLHSFSAADLRSTYHNWAGPLLAKGATATMGCVDEPYLGGTPDMAVFASRFIFQGMTFGEAAYASEPVLSWQITFVGDPLYCPFGKPTQDQVAELEKNKSPLVDWLHVRVVNLNLARGLAAGTVAPYLEQLDRTKQSAVLSEKLGDLYVAQGKPSSAIDMYERALKLDPSPQQRVRLRLELAEKLKSTDRDADALADLEMLLEENPGYPNKLDLCQKLESLAEKLKKKEAIAKYAELVRRYTPAPPSTNKPADKPTGQTSLK